MLGVVAAGLNGLIAQSITRDVCDAIVTDKNDVQWKPWYMTLKNFSCSSMFGIGFNNNGMN